MLSFELLSINLYIDLLNYLHLGCSLEEEFNVVGKVFDSWYVNSKTLLEDTVGELKANARVVEDGRHVPVGEFPQGEYLVEYLGIPVKLLVVDDYKGYGRRKFEYNTFYIK